MGEGSGGRYGFRLTGPPAEVGFMSLNLVVLLNGQSWRGTVPRSRPGLWFFPLDPSKSFYGPFTALRGDRHHFTPAAIPGRICGGQWDRARRARYGCNVPAFERRTSARPAVIRAAKRQTLPGFVPIRSGENALGWSR